MIEDDFYATLKLKSGEEIFAKVSPCEEEDRMLLLVNNPIVITEIKGKNGVIGYKIEPWLKTTSEDLFIVDIDNIITMSESFDVEMIQMYQSYVRQAGFSKGNYQNTKLNRKMGYIANVNDAKEILEKLYKKS
jgi:hypothetical protein